MFYTAVARAVVSVAEVALKVASSERGVAMAEAVAVAAVT